MVSNRWTIVRNGRDDTIGDFDLFTFFITFFADVRFSLEIITIFNSFKMTPTSKDKEIELELYGCVFPDDFDKFQQKLKKYTALTRTSVLKEVEAEIEKADITLFTSKACRSNLLQALKKLYE